ncbi:MAG TPA: MFS transporter [Planctomycetota bacterium]|nr:MFS transporter [Planctomycetota bacterium]
MKGLRRRLALDRPELLAWAMYDWANSAMLTVVVTAVFPIFYASVAADGLAPEVATSRFTLTTAICMSIAAVISPVLGALADVSAKKKRFLAVFMLIGAAACAAMFFLSRGEWLFALFLFGLANIGATASFVFYDSLLPHIARPGEIDRISTSGYALGYVGGGIALAGILWLIQSPEQFGLPPAGSEGGASATLPARLSFVIVALWWIVFSIPLFRRVPEPARTIEPDESAVATPLVRTAVTRLSETARELTRYRQALLLLCAFLAYNDGIGTIIRMAAIYGEEMQIPRSTMIGAILAVQFIGVPCSFAFGALSGRYGAKRLILFSIVVYMLISVLAWRMSTSWHFWALAILVGVVQGGSQALSRSLFASMIPRHKSGEFFGLFSVLEKFAGILGPGLFWLAQLATGSSRHAILSVVVFFVVGGWLLVKVDVEAGQKAAAEADSGLRVVS